MLSRPLSLLALLALVACDEPGPDPVRPEGALLEPGRYDLLVRDVVATACDTDPGVVRGQAVPAELAMGRDGVSLALGDWVLHGAMEPGNLHVAGVLDEGGREPEPVEDVDGDTDDEVEPGESEGEASEGDDGDASEGEDEEHPEERDPVEPEDRPDRDPRVSLLLDARILDPQLAEGSLFLSMPGCEVELSVVLGRGGRPDAPEEPTHPPREGEERPDEGDDEGDDEVHDEGDDAPREG